MIFNIVLTVFVVLDTFLILMLYKYLELKGIIRKVSKAKRESKNNEIKKG